MDTQLDFLEDFDASERRRKARHAIIDQITAAAEVKELLHVLADLPQIADEFGNSHVTVGIRRIGALLSPKQKSRKGKPCEGRSRNIVRKEIRLACESGYLQILDPSTNDDQRTYVIRWRSIVNREANQTSERAAERTVRPASNMRAAERTAADARGSIRDPEGGQLPLPRGSIPAPEGVNFVAGGGQFEGVNSPHTPSEYLLREKQISKNHSSPSEPSSMGPATERAPRSHRSQRRLEAREKTRAVCWPLWERAVSCRNLASPEQVQTLYVVAVELEIVEDTELNRFRVFGQAAKQVRMCRTGQAKTRYGLFVSNVARNNWMCNNEDEETARLMIRRADLNRPAEAPEVREEIEAVCAVSVQSIPGDVKPLTKEQCDAKKEVIRLRMLEKFPELFNLPY